MERFAVLQLDRLFSRGPAIDPRLESVVTRWKPFQSKASTCVRHHKVRTIQNQDQSAHVFVNVAPKYDKARLIENLRRDRSFIRPITPKIKTFGRRVGKNVVISVIKIWEFNFGSDPHREKRRNERQILLCDLFRWQRNWLGKRTLEINHRQRRLRGKNAAFGDELITFRLVPLQRRSPRAQWEGWEKPRLAKATRAGAFSSV